MNRLAGILFVFLLLVAIAVFPGRSEGDGYYGNRVVVPL
jgi:hypothetical protein